MKRGRRLFGIGRNYLSRGKQSGRNPVLGQITSRRKGGSVGRLETTKKKTSISAAIRKKKRGNERSLGGGEEGQDWDRRRRDQVSSEQPQDRFCGKPPFPKG